MLPDTLRLSKQSELIEMSTQGSSGNGNGGPSVKERVRAMHDHIDVFKMIAEYPQTGIYITFPEEFAQARAFAESEVFRSSRAAKCYLQRSVQPEDPSPDDADYRRVMMDLVSSLLYLVRVVKASRQMNSFKPPSKDAMDLYRAKSCVKEPGRRGANGEMALMYGQVGEPVPPNVATVDDEVLSPMAQFICEWILNPLVDYIVEPPKNLLLQLPMYKRRHAAEGDNIGSLTVKSRTIEAVAEAFVYVLAILVLVAPIATFTVVEKQSQRIVIMPLFCLLLAASAQLMGSRARPTFIIVIAYFQAMVFYVGNPNDG